MREFREVSSLHGRLNELFYEHQRALLDFDFRSAIARLARYERALLAHMSDEEEKFLPLYAERARPERGGAPDFFLLEHRKMRRMIEHFRAELPKLLGLSDPARALLKLLDQQTTYKHLVEHHDVREEKFLYPALDHVTSPAERDELLAGLAAPD